MSEIRETPQEVTKALHAVKKLNEALQAKLGSCGAPHYGIEHAVIYTAVGTCYDVYKLRDLDKAEILGVYSSIAELTHAVWGMWRAIHMFMPKLEDVQHPEHYEALQQLMSAAERMTRWCRSAVGKDAQGEEIAYCPFCAVSVPELQRYELDDETIHEEDCLWRCLKEGLGKLEETTGGIT